MDFFYGLIVISFSLSIFLCVSFNFLYKRLSFCIEKINEIERLNEQALGIIQRLKEDVSECMQVTDCTQQDQRKLNESFDDLKIKLSGFKGNGNRASVCSSD